jgi:energy-coupling factor transport system permease protein
MAEFEFLGQVSIGQYVPTDSWLHKIDARAKLVVALLWMTAAIISQSLLGLILGIAVIYALVAGAGVPLRFAWRSVRASLPILLILAVLQLLTFSGDDHVLWRWWRITISLHGLRLAALLLTRFLALIGLVSVLSFTTKTGELVHGVEQLTRPLQRIGFPAHEFALMWHITLRFVPLLAIEAERLAKAQASRGGEWGTGAGGLIKRVRRVVPLIVPLFLAALQRAERLALAMEARAYVGGKGRSHLISDQMQTTDWLFVIGMALVAILIVIV